MRALVIAVAFVSSLAVAPSLASAQQQLAFAPATPPADVVIATSAPNDAPVARVRTWLRNLASAEEGYYAEHGTYTTDLLPLGVGPDLSGPYKSDSVRVAVLYAGGRSWSAVATHAGARGKSCVMFVGDLADFPSPPVTTSERRPASAAGAVTCDRF